MLDSVIPSPYTVSEGIWMVPCVKSMATNEFKPLSKPLSSEMNLSYLQSRQTWLPEEDQNLISLVNQQGAKNWSKIAKKLNKRIHKRIPVRLAKQCRERFFNHLSPNLNKEKWTSSEDLIILQKQRQIGNKWSKIAKFLDRRTENQVKNRFKGLFNKGLKLSPEEPLSCLIQTLQNQP